MVLIYTTCPNTAEAVKLGGELLSGRLAAAVNLWPMQTMMRADGGVKSELEAGMFIKTTEPRITEIETIIEKHRTDKVPYIGAIDIRRFNRPYREWMITVVKE